MSVPQTPMRARSTPGSPCRYEIALRMSRICASGSSRLRRIRTFAVCCEKRSRSSQRTRLGEIQEAAALAPAAIVDRHRDEAARWRIAPRTSRSTPPVSPQPGASTTAAALLSAREPLRQEDPPEALHAFAEEPHVPRRDAVGMTTRALARGCAISRDTTTSRHDDNRGVRGRPLFIAAPASAAVVAFAGARGRRDTSGTSPPPASTRHRSRCTSTPGSASARERRSSAP